MSTGTPAAEVNLDAELLSELLRAQHPDLADLPVTPVAAGWDNMMFRLGDELAVRMPRRKLAAQLIEHEQHWLPMLAKRLPLPTPQPLRRGAPALGYPWRWSVVPWLHGEPADVSPPAAAEAVVVAQFLRALHVSAPADAPLNPYRGVPLQQRAATVDERLVRLERTTELIGQDIKDAWRAGVDAAVDVDPTWIHGDLHARNVLVDGGRVSAVIDWGDLARGDRATDLAAIWTLLPDASARRAAVAVLAEVSPSTWTRARGWAVFFGATLLDTGLVNDARNAALGRTLLQRIREGT